MRAFAGISCVLLLAAEARGQVAYAGGAYSQNFDTLPGTSNNTTNAAWTDNVTLPGWYSGKTSYSVTDGTIGGSAAGFNDTAVANNAGLFSFGLASDTDRALGSRATSNGSGNDPVLYGVRLVNNTGRTLSRFTITYTGEQWFKSTEPAAHTLVLDYQFGATGIASGVWSPLAAATFTAPVSGNPTATTLNGNSTANRAVIVAVVSSVSWTPGQELWLRIRDGNESGYEQGLAVDDFTFLADNETGLFFNGGSSYVSMGGGPAGAAAFGAGDFTLECRFLRTGEGVSASSGGGGVVAVPLVAKGAAEEDGNTKDGNYFLGIDSSGRLAADFEQRNATNNNGTAYPAGQNFPVLGSTILQNGVWYHVAATYNTTSATWKLYVNGVAETTTVPSGSPATFPGVIPRYDSIQGLGIGTAIDSTGMNYGYFHGVIDEVRIWNIARTEAQILANKDVEIPSGQAGMLARFGLDEATGTSASGTTQSGAATPSGTLSGSSIPVWTNAKGFLDPANLPPVVTSSAPGNEAGGIGGSTTVSVNVSDPENAATTVTFHGRKTTPITPGADFTLVAIPDTQYYSENLYIYPESPGSGANISYFNAQTEWIRNNRTSRNIAFVSHMGDIVQNGDFAGNPAEWIRADAAMKTIEDNSTTLLAHGIPWGVAPGNHDMGTGYGSGTTTFFNQYFGTSRFTGRSYYGGRFGTNNNNNYQLFSASGLDFIIIHLEYNDGALSGYQAVLDWADALLKAYPNRRGIVTSHYILNAGNPAPFSPQGQNIYSELKDNPNLFLMLCGHIHGEGRRTDSYMGREVHSILQDYQEAANGGNGFLRTFRFSPANNLITAEMYSPGLNRLATTADVSTALGTFTLPYDMQNPTTGWIPLGTVNLAAGASAASLSWTGLETGSRYEWYATASDGNSVGASEIRRFSTASPVLPTLTLTSPLNGAVYVQPSLVQLSASAGATVARVEFYAGSSKLGEDSTAPFEFNWSGPPLGTHLLTAVAVDGSGRAGLSNVVRTSFVQQGSEDRDGDSIPDAYELAHGLDRYNPADASLDRDGDGLSNFREFVFGTSAGTPDKYSFSVSRNPLSGHNLLSFSTITGRTYRVMYSDDLSSWSHAGSPISGTGSTVEWTDNGSTTNPSPASTTRRFYRIEVIVDP